MRVCRYTLPCCLAEILPGEHGQREQSRTICLINLTGEMGDADHRKRFHSLVVASPELVSACALRVWVLSECTLSQPPLLQAARFVHVRAASEGRFGRFVFRSSVFEIWP